LTEEGRKAFEAYRAKLEELYLSRCEVMWHGTVLKDTTPITFKKPKVWPNPSSSHNDIQVMINFTLERQAKSTDELLRRLIEEQNGKKLCDTSANPSSSTFAVSFTQTNPYTSGPSAGGTSMPNPSTQPMNCFHSWTTIEGLAPTLGMPHQTTTSMFGQGYMQTAPRFPIPNFTSAMYTSGGNGWAYTHASSNYQAMYTTVAYTGHILLPGSSLGFLRNHAYYWWSLSQTD
jgi:hypothetical protein